MDPVNQLLALRQGELSIEDYIHQFSSSHQIFQSLISSQQIFEILVSEDLLELLRILSTIPESRPMAVGFPEPCSVLSGETNLKRQRMASSVEDPPLVSIRTAGNPKPTHINPVLYAPSGSIVPIPEPVHNMAATSKTVYNVAAMSEAVDLPEPSQVIVDLTEPRHVSADTPEPRHVSADLPEPRHVSADLPEPRHVSADLPESRHVSTDHPESHPVMAIKPVSTDKMAAPPESTNKIAAPPVSTDKYLSRILHLMFPSTPHQRLVLIKPWASQDDIRGGTFQHHECDFLGVHAADAERQCGGEIMNMTTAQRFSIYGVDAEVLLASLAMYV
ncbi:hypothetical protein DPX16_2694 [Anabarilius grahami]|uniref:Uncharacterized protein n=1 Tax=Anabarilius grahami TaxID=495550 RepID=A0A3N0YPH1_ANAGA|nr:hypothetical protein DPX16_2694 [Anabarilius grahami]